MNNLEALRVASDAGELDNLDERGVVALSLGEVIATAPDAHKMKAVLNALELEGEVLVARPNGEKAVINF